VTWIRVETQVARSRLVDVLRTFLGLSKIEAVGAVVCLWCECTNAANGGYIGELSDAWIEDAAGWTGAPGKLAAVIRERHLSDGRIKDWDEYQGVLETRRATDAARKRAEREAERLRTSNGQPTGRPPDVLPKSGCDVDVDGNDTKRQTKLGAPRARAHEANADALVAKLGGPDGANLDRARAAVEKFLAALPDSESPVKWVQTLDVNVLGGLQMPAQKEPRAEHVLIALEQWDVSGKRLTVANFASFVERVRHDHKADTIEPRMSRAAEQQMANILGPDWKTQGGVT
jgi:hypothetical protein